MKKCNCPNCGASQLEYSYGFAYCKYCSSRLVIEKNDKPQAELNFELGDDIENLLQKCKENPSNAKKYANLILDIDPTNVEAKKYL